MTIPASAIVSVLPSVLNAGGNGLVLNGIMINSTPQLVSGVFTGPGYRVPIGQVLSFASAAAVGSYFGLSSQEYAKAQIGAVSTFVHTLPNSLGTLSFTGIINNFDHSAPMEKTSEWTLKVKISASVTYAHS